MQRCWCVGTPAHVSAALGWWACMQLSIGHCHQCMSAMPPVIPPAKVSYAHTELLQQSSWSHRRQTGRTHNQRAAAPGSDSSCAVGLHTQTARAKKDAPPESATDKVLAEEADMMRHITQKQALRAAKELATDTVYTRSMKTGWKPPAEAREHWQLAATQPSALSQYFLAACS